MSLKRAIFIGFLCLVTSQSACTRESTTPSHTDESVGENRLGQEKSPYLLQHKNNPVHWYAWGPEAIEAAKVQNKVIFLSIGYSTCYWCHMMEKDSFEKQDVADVLNKNFINIKVDREERPDIDRVYMDAVTRMTRRGGWPLTVFLTPDLQPFYGGTFFWRPQFLALLERIQTMWTTEPEKVLQIGHNLTESLQREGQLSRGQIPDEQALRNAFYQFQKRFDKDYGGFSSSPKFPPDQKLRALLRIYRRTGSKQALKMVTKTLDQMAAGGLYDHVGGGFHRYTTDVQWRVPHFEKMLYNNAQLAMTYLEAYQVTGFKPYARIARETLDYVLRDMTSPQGGFYSAEDAGEVNLEGEFYVWKWTELKDLLSAAELKKLRSAYDVNKAGNFEHNANILYYRDAQQWRSKRDPKLKPILNKLLTARKERQRPHLDDKILTAWNGLMISAMARGYQVLGDTRYLQAAGKSAEFIKTHLTQDGKLLRRYRDGDARYPAYLNDYAYLIEGLIDLYEADYKAKWLAWAIELQGIQNELFYDPTDRSYYFTDDQDKSVLVRQKKIQDGALPSGNGVSALNLLRLYSLTLHPEYQKMAEGLLRALARPLDKAPSWVPQSLLALDYYLDDSKEIAVIPGTTDPSLEQFRAYLKETFLPNQVVVVGSDNAAPPEMLRNLLLGKKPLNNKTTFYVCEESHCKKPTAELKEAQKLMEAHKPYTLR